MLCLLISSALQGSIRNRLGDLGHSATIRIFGVALPEGKGKELYDISMLWIDVGDFCESYAVHAEEGR